MHLRAAQPRMHASPLSSGERLLRCAQGAQDAAASAAQALLTEVIGRAESALSSIGGIADNLELLYGKYEDAFCEQAYIKPSVWMPPNVTGALNALLWALSLVHPILSV